MEVWPGEGLERVPACPVCGGEDRSPLHEALSDRIWFIAPGEWTLWTCRECRAAYLDPRPTRGTIALAYRDYPLSKARQQSNDDATAAPRSALDRKRRALRNGYMNARYGYSFAPAIGAGRFLLPLFPRRRESADWSCRHLRKRTTLLDVGCGNGEALVRMARAGWVVHGVEPDP
jgi:hypothetical protein